MRSRESRTSRIARFVVPAAVIALGGGADRAEPHLAVRSGLTCTSCHVNRTGGGGRTAYGSGYGARTLPWKWRELQEENALFDGALGERVRLGADLRAAYAGTLRESGPYIGEYVVEEANLYLAVSLLPNRLTLVVDESIAPGGALNREAFALLTAGKAGLWVKAGRFFPPYGIRLQDDEAAIRRFTGFNFDSPDTGVELGVEARGWSSALALTNGTAGGPEADNGKQVSWIGAYVRQRWRAGLSAAANDLPGPNGKSQAGAFAALRAGPMVMLAEWDFIRADPGDTPTAEGIASHLEADWTPRDGITLRVWAGRFDPDRDVDDDRFDQIGLGADWTPLPGLQVRGFYRREEGPLQVEGSGDDFAAVELHVYF